MNLVPKVKLLRLIFLLAIAGTISCQNEKPGTLTLKITSGTNLTSAFISARVYTDQTLVAALPHGQTFNSSDGSELVMQEVNEAGAGNGTEKTLPVGSHTLYVMVDDDNNGSVLIEKNWLSGNKYYHENFRITGDKTITIDSSELGSTVEQPVSFTTGVSALEDKKGFCLFYLAGAADKNSDLVFFGRSELKSNSLDSSGNGITDTMFRQIPTKLDMYCYADADGDQVADSGDYEQSIEDLTPSSSTYSLSSFNQI